MTNSVLVPGLTLLSLPSIATRTPSPLTAHSVNTVLPFLTENEGAGHQVLVYHKIETQLIPVHLTAILC